MDLKFQVYGKIKKPVSELFDAVYNPKKLSAYFTTGGASAPLDEGATVTWDFHDFPGAFPVRVTQCVPDKKIAIEWKAQDGDYNTAVEFTFTPLDAESSKIEIQESGWKQTPEGLKSSYGNCFGWTQFLCCLKAYLENGIRMREFFF